MPDAITTWIQALVRHRRAILEIDRGAEQTLEAAAAADPVLAALERRHERLAQLRRIMTDRSRTSFVFVMIPERLAIEETARAAEQLADTGVDVGGLVVNRVLPDGLEGEFYRSRKAQEETYLKEIDRRFARLPRVRVRQLPRDVYGLESLALVSDQLVDTQSSLTRRGPRLRLLRPSRVSSSRMLGQIASSVCRSSRSWDWVFHILFLAAAPFEHHDLICHLKTPQHCTSCASNPLGSESRICRGARRLPRSPTPARIFALDALAEGALLAVTTHGRSPPSFS